MSSISGLVPPLDRRRAKGVRPEPFVYPEFDFWPQRRAIGIGSAAGLALWAAILTPIVLWLS